MLNTFAIVVKQIARYVVFYSIIQKHLVDDLKFCIRIVKILKNRFLFLKITFYIFFFQKEFLKKYINLIYEFLAEINLQIWESEITVDSTKQFLNYV